MRFDQTTALRVILVLIGSFIVFVGVNVAFGGIQTLGWQVAQGFVSVNNPPNFLIQDNHVRFLGGVFGAVGVMLLLGATHLQRYQAELRLVFVLIFVGGLARFTALQPSVILGPNVITSLITELVVMPILFFWLPRTVKNHPS